MKLLLFEEFLNEGISDKDLISEINRMLNLNKKHGAEDWQYAQIPTNWKTFNKKSKVETCDISKPSECYDNALDYSKNTGMDLYIGIFVNRDQLEKDIKWLDSDDESEVNKVNPWYGIYPHAFNVDKSGKIYDVTIDNDMNEYVYIGTKIDHKKFKKGFDNVMPYLNKLIQRS